MITCYKATQKRMIMHCQTDTDSGQSQAMSSHELICKEPICDRSCHIAHIGEHFVLNLLRISVMPEH